MELGFFDQLTSKVDTKGRVSVPASHRAELAAGDPECLDGKNPRMMLIHSFSHQHCLRGFTIKEYKKIRKKIARMEYGDDKQEVVEQLIEMASMVQMDDNGRIILRKDIRDRFNIGAAAVFVGSDDHLQIWDQEVRGALEAKRAGSNPYLLLNKKPKKG